MKRVAVIYDDGPRPETTGEYCLRALRGLVDAEYVSPAKLQGLAAKPFDLYLFVDDGTEYPIPEMLRPSAFWAIDTHLDFQGTLAKSRQHDFVFAAQKDGADRLRAAGIASARWLPLACDPAIHRPHPMPKEHDLCFIGNILPGPREELLRLLRARHPSLYVAQLYFDEMARAYSASKIVFNRSVRNDVNMRVFEALACGSLLVTNDLHENGQNELFEPGVHLVTYTDTDDLFEKIDFHLANDEARERIAARGRAEVIARHTYRHRMEALLAVVFPSGVGVQASACVGAQASARVGVQASACVGVQASACADEPAARPSHDQVNGASTACKVQPRRLKPELQLPYFEFERPELAALVPESARRVLDVGCGAGRLGAAIKSRQPAIVWGVEQDIWASECAKRRLDRVVVGDVEEVDLAPGEAQFDCILCGDILEHVIRPLALLRKLRTWLAAEGVIVASIPNVRHHSVVCGLLEGNWTYESAGLLDRTHVRFFMKSSIARLFQEAGLTITRWGHTSIGDYEAWESHGRPAAVNVGRLQVECATPEETEEFFIYQYLVVARISRGTEWRVETRD
jgi:2-polyprenyl-3-methyl-5-hydroxy-6-metoxy-1,4-benzoquinol methylase